MAYGLRYFGEFHWNNDNLTVQFLKKGFTGTAQALVLPFNPVVHSWDEDDPYAPVRGSSLEINIKNEGVQIDDFYTVEDNGFKCRLLSGADVLFDGYLVQEDFQANIVEHPDAFKLSANDNLGLLSDISLDEADRLYGSKQTFTSQIIIASNPGEPLVVNISQFPPNPLAGQTVIFDNTGTVLDGIPYKILTATPLTLFYTLYLEGTTTVPQGYYTGTSVTYITPTDFNQKLPISYFLKTCLLATGLELNTDAICNLRHVFVEFGHLFTRTYLRGTDLKSGDDFLSCREVLERIMRRFKASLFQAEGKWNIVRYSEYKITRYNVRVSSGQIQFWSPDYTTFSTSSTITFSNAGALNGTYNITSVTSVNGQITVLTSVAAPTGYYPDVSIALNGTGIVNKPYVFRFNSEFQTAGQQTFNSYLSRGGSDIAYAPIKTLIRPLMRSREYFAYTQPPVLLLNENFTLVGAPRPFYTTGSGNDLKYIEEYEMPDNTKYKGFFYNGTTNAFTETTYDFFIRVIKDVNRNEVERFLVIAGNSTSLPNAMSFVYVEVNNGDKVGFQASARSSSGTNPNAALTFVVQTQSVPNRNQTLAPNVRPTLRQDGSWQSGAGTVSNAFIDITNADITQWQNLSIQSKELPIDGRLYIQLPKFNNSGETHIKDVSLNIESYIGGQKAVKGHQHTTSQPLTIKKVEDENTYIDDSPKNTIQGTLFAAPYPGELLAARTIKWNRPNYFEEKRLGEVTTLQDLIDARIQRVKAEGDTTNIKPSKYLSPLNLIIWNRFPDLRMIFGKLEIEYGNDMANFTMYELCKTAEKDSDLLSSYDYRYKYE